MLDRNGRRFTFLYRSADKGLLASAGLSSASRGENFQVVGRELPHRREL